MRCVLDPFSFLPSPFTISKPPAGVHSEGSLVWFLPSPILVGLTPLKLIDGESDASRSLPFTCSSLFVCSVFVHVCS
jgi:hypothetical protein